MGLCGRSRGPETPPTHPVWQGGPQGSCHTYFRPNEALCLPRQASSGASAGGCVDGGGDFPLASGVQELGPGSEPSCGHHVPGAAHGDVSPAPPAARTPHAATGAISPAPWASSILPVTTHIGEAAERPVHPSDGRRLRGARRTTLGMCHPAKTFSFAPSAPSCPSIGSSTNERLGSAHCPHLSGPQSLPRGVGFPGCCELGGTGRRAAGGSVTWATATANKQVSPGLGSGRFLQSSGAECPPDPHGATGSGHTAFPSEGPSGSCQPWHAAD